MEPVLLKQKDRYTLQIKARYVLDRSDSTTNNYRVRAYLFFPQPFGIGPNSFMPRTFFDQIVQYLRFHTPDLSVEELLNPLSEESPLVRIEREMHRAELHGEVPDLGTLRYEARLLGAIYKSILRDAFYLAEEPEDPDSQGRPHAVTEHALDRVVEVTKRFHAVIEKARSNPLSAAAAEELALIDEHLSLSVEQYFSSYLVDSTGATADTVLGRARAAGKGKADHKAPQAERTAWKVGAPGVITAMALEAGRTRQLPAPIAEYLAKTIEKEEKYRRKMGYPTCPTGMTDTRKLEEYVYRKTMLRRYVAEVLHFEVRRKNTFKKTEHILYALAAGVAMLVATVISFYGQFRYGNATLSLGLLLVGGYMIKDRLKDYSRDYFSRKLGRFFSDRTLEVRADQPSAYRARGSFARRLRRLLKPTRAPRMAAVAIRTAFVPEKRLPKDIRDLRNRGYFERTVVGAESETTLVYDKRIRLNAKVLRTIHNRVRGLADVSMVNFEPFLRGLAVQHGLVPDVVGKHAVRVRQIRRVYHLNLIIEYQSPSGCVLQRFRLIVNRRGIERIEPVRMLSR